MNKEIKIYDTAIPNGVKQIAQQLPSPSEVKSGELITLTFPREFVFLTGLVLLATWRKSLDPNVIVNVNDSNCEYAAKNFLTNTGFREIIDTGHETPSTQKRIGRVPLQPITNQFTKEATVNDIVSIFDEYAGHIDDTSPFKTMISELCENVLAHSDFMSPGYVCARTLEKPGKAEIAICDSGVGMKQSYLNGTNAPVIERIKKGASPLMLAIDGLNSSKPQPVSGTLISYYGFGLLVTRRLIEENRGQLFLMSGNEALYVNQEKRDLYTLSKPYFGTFIGIVLDLNNPLPLESIYEQLTAEYTGHKHSQPHDAQNHQTRHHEEKQETPSGIETSDTDNQDPMAPQQKKLELRHYGTELLTRDAGTAIRADIAGFLAAGYHVEISLDGVSDITPSVADEAFAKLAQILGQKNFEDKVTIVGGTQLANRLINFVIKTRQRKGN